MRDKVIHRPPHRKPPIPKPPHVRSNKFHQKFRFSLPVGKGHKVAQRTGTIQLSSPVDPSVFSQPFTITGSTVAGLATQNIDLMNPANNSFQANDGDVLTESGTQVNHTGTSPVSAPITIVVAAGVVTPGAPPPPPPIPVPPVVASNTFV